MLFFLAGLGPTSTILTFLSYELCVNPDIQRKLYDEIVETNESLAGQRISYDKLQKMKYLDQVVSEGLRKWPPTPNLDRVCVKDYECEYGDNARFHFERGLPIWISVYGLHHDPKYYPEPEKFDPERFSDENKHNIVPGTYLPFGLGPRNCIGKHFLQNFHTKLVTDFIYIPSAGSRFALMTIKATLYNILLSFELQPNAKSQIPIKLVRSPYVLLPQNAFHLDLSPRSHSQA